MSTPSDVVTSLVNEPDGDKNNGLEPVGDVEVEDGLTVLAHEPVPVTTIVTLDVQPTSPSLEDIDAFEICPTPHELALSICRYLVNTGLRMPVVPRILEPSAGEGAFVAAAKAAYAHDFIMAFPRGYATQVGEHGMQVAGGERQRIAVARALLKDAPVILLDEATASLDSESERQVQGAIEHLCQGRTTIVIAHRLHTVVDAHRIFVIEDGTVVESGRHDELLRKSGRYASFYRLQLRDQEAGPPGEAA